MTGETNLAVLLRNLQPHLADTEYGFGIVRPGQTVPPDVQPIGTFAETEGLTIIAPADQLAAHDVTHSAGWALITLRVHSSLSAVGMMAEIARTLANAGISVNAVAAYHHDHIFVQWDRRHDAVRLLSAIAD